MSLHDHMIKVAQQGNEIESQYWDNKITGEGEYATYSFEKEYQNVFKDWCMYFWIRQDIKMKKGKMAGQVAHASARLARQMDDHTWSKYILNEVKIVYKVPDMEALLSVQDELGEIEFGTMVFDNTWETHTVYGIATQTNLRHKNWKLA